MAREPYTTGYPCDIFGCIEAALHDIDITGVNPYHHYCPAHAERMLKRLYPLGLPTQNATKRPGVWTDAQLDATTVAS